MFSLFTNYYYIIIILQAVCAIHCIRKGNQNKWIWLIIFIPLVGCIAYIFTEIFTRNELQQVQSGVSSIFNPTGKIRSLRENLRFRDTFDNRIALADAYLGAGQVDSAIELYEKSLVGAFSEHEHGSMQLVRAYFEKNRFDDLVRIAKKLYNLPQFKRSGANMQYAIALGYTNQTEAAEKEFLTMTARFSNYECRYQYGKFLTRMGRAEDAKKLYQEVLNEASHLSSSEKKKQQHMVFKNKGGIKKLTGCLRFDC